MAVMWLVGVYIYFRFADMFQKAGAKRWAAVLLSIATIAALFWRMKLIGLFAYIALFIIAGDLITLAAKNNKRWKKFWRGGLTGIGLAIVLAIYGYFNAYDIKTKHYSIAIAKEAGDLDGVRIVLLADTHFGTSIGEREMTEIAERINELQPDLVLLGGDIYDESTPPHIAAASLDMWRSIVSTYGIYFVGGNHEYGRYHGRDVVPVGLSASGVVILEDEAVLIDNSFWLVGRRDIGGHGGKKSGLPQRMQVSMIMEGLDTSRPVIVLDHQPTELDLLAAEGADLHLSGHTHGGQIWPFGQISVLMRANEELYGLYRRGHMHGVVSSGTGVWRFPMRVGTNSEIVVIDVAFGG